MKIIKIKNPLPEERIKQFDKYFKKIHYCNCGVTFEINILDVALNNYSKEKKELDNYYAEVTCPFCGKTYDVGLFRLSKKDLQDIEKYKQYLRNKNKFNIQEETIDDDQVQDPIELALLAGVDEEI